MFGIDDAAIATLGAGVLSAGASIFGAQSSQAAAKEMNAKQLAWEREKALNAHQWEVQDLEKAGLNPILSAGGSGASTGSISPLIGDYSGYGQAGNAISSAVMSMYQADIMKAQAQNIEADTLKKEAETKESGSRVKLNEQQISNLKKQINKIDSDIQRNSILNSKDKAEISKIGHQITQIDSEVELNRVEMELRYAKKDLTKELQLLTTIQEKQGIETYKGQIMDNKIRSVNTKMRYIDKYLDTMGKAADNAGSILGAVGPML